MRLTVVYHSRGLLIHGLWELINMGKTVVYFFSPARCLVRKEISVLLIPARKEDIGNLTR